MGIVVFSELVELRVQVRLRSEQLVYEEIVVWSLLQSLFVPLSSSRLVA